MEKAKRRTILISCLIALVLVVALMAALFLRSNTRKPLEIESLSAVQCENLNTLCRVWGLAKYHHPVLASGARNWDKELITLLPEVLQASDREQAHALLAQWVIGLGEVTQGVPYDYAAYNISAVLSPEYTWLEAEALSPQLKAALTPLLSTFVEKRSKGPFYYTEMIRPSFSNEKEYANMNEADDGLRFVALFRYWNMIEYYFPYKNLMDQDWDSVLEEFIPRMIEGDGLGYMGTMAELVARIQDSHAVFYGGRSEWGNFWGSKMPSFTFEIVDGQVVVNNLTNLLMPGDVITRCNGLPMDELIAQKLRYLSVSREDAATNRLAVYLFATNEDSMLLDLVRQGEAMRIEVPCSSNNIREEATSASYERLDGNIGVIYPRTIKKGEIDAIMAEFADTQGIIVDMRQYPSVPIVFDLANYLLDRKVTYFRMFFPDDICPGQFYTTVLPSFICGTENPNYYKGKVVILMNGDTISQSETTVMALRQAPRATVIGTNSAGANGDVVTLTLPGGIQTSFSGFGILTPEGGQTQRIGLAPDIVCKPTIEGITKGRDELLEAAVLYIQGQ